MIRLWVALAAAVALLPSQAGAQGLNPNNISISSFNPGDAVAPISSVEGPGVKVGEGTVIHPVFGIETGVISNVFYVPENARAAGVLRILGQVGAGSLTTARLSRSNDPNDADADPGGFVYRADLRASYDVMLSDNDAVSGTGGLGLGATVRLKVNPAGRVSFGADDDFVRLIRAANFETDANTNRDINNLGLQLQYHPSDRTFGGFVYYNNTLDIFERAEQSFADRMFHKVGIHPTWQWLPQTQLFADISQGYVSGLGSDADMKASSAPFAANAGIATLLTLKTTLNLYGGYTNGFYSSGPSFSGPMLGAAFGYRYSPLGRITAQYQWKYEDSINANYYRDHVVQVSVQQLIDPVIIMVQPELHLRQYNGVTIVNGPPTRDDLIFATIAGVHYNFRNWIAATLNYRFSMVETDYRYMGGGMSMLTDPSYVRHELLLGMRVAL